MGKPKEQEFKTFISNLFKARFPYLYIPTWEDDRALTVIRSLASDPSFIKTPREVVVWNVIDGFAGKKDTAVPIKALDFIANFPEPAIFILKDFHMFFGANHRPIDYQIIRKIRDLSLVLRQSPNPKNVVFLSPSLVLPHDLQKDITIVDFDLPSFEEIKHVLDELVLANRKSGRIKIDLTAEDEKRLANAAMGLTLNEAENAFARAMVEDGCLNRDDVEVILEEKRQIIKKTEVLEFIKSDFKMDDVGGLENLKRWLNKRDKSWSGSAEKYGLPAPKGVLITGVPGCGKSLIAKSISAMWQLPLLRLDMGKIFSGIVGSSEENMRKAIKTAEAISPSVLWIDEIEKGFSHTSSSGDSGTSSRIFGTFLTWMQEKSKPVFVVATANNIQALPPELLRKGRFDEIFFVDLPTKRERMDIFQLHMKKRLKDPTVIGDFVLTEDILEHLANMTEGYVGAEIEQVVISGLFEAFSEDRSIRLNDFEKSIRNMIPLSVTQAESIQRIRDWANVRAVSATANQDRTEYQLSIAKKPMESTEQKQDDVSSSRGGRAIDF